MEEHNFRPCGFRNCYRSKHSISLCSFSKVTTGDKNSSGVTSTIRAGSPKLAGERGNMRSPVLRRRFLQSVICNPKKGRNHASNYRPESSKSLHRHTAFSNGELGYSKISCPTKSLHDQDRSQGRILFGSYSPSESEIPEIPVEKQSIPVLFSSVRSEHCTVSVYSPHETSSRFPEETGRSPTPVPGRYAHNWFDPSRSQRLHTDGCESPKSVGVHNQPGQIGSNPNSGYNVSRVYNQFNNHAFHSTLRESAEITNTVPTDSFELDGSPSNPGLTSGPIGILSPSRVASTSSFSLPTSSPHQRSEPNESHLRGSSFVMLSVPRGNQLVATESRNSQWQPDYNTIFRSDNIHRCLFDGLGSCLWEHQNPWEVVCHRETVAHINVLELKGAMLGIQSGRLLKNQSSKIISLNMDSSTAVAYVNHKGGTHSPELLQVALQLWNWCIQRNLFIIAYHVPGKTNVVADRESREFIDNSDWKIDPIIIFPFLSDCSTDLFASRLTHQLARYISWRPDPQAFQSDAFIVNWKHLKGYAFPPFNFIARVLDKVMMNKTDLVLVAPIWQAQP